MFAMQLSGLNNRQVALSDVTFGFEDARNASQRQFARRHLGGTSSIAAERHPGVRSLGQLGTLDTQLRAMAPQVHYLSMFLINSTLKTEAVFAFISYCIQMQHVGVWITSEPNCCDCGDSHRVFSDAHSTV